MMASGLWRCARQSCLDKLMALKLEALFLASVISCVTPWWTQWRFYMRGI
jgi:hypothetical protein